jgi:hypothetical protein
MLAVGGKDIEATQLSYVSVMVCASTMDIADGVRTLNLT